MKVKTPLVISLYSGAGGLDLGFKQAGFKIVYSVDNWKPACDTLGNNEVSSFVECKDIRDVNFKDILTAERVRAVDCVIGGPPCPAYSKSRFYLKDKKRSLEDENSYTLYEYFRAIEELNPPIFFFENVFGFVYKPHRNALDYLVNRSQSLGYSVQYKVVNAANYGIPQIRERFICVGTRKPLPIFQFPKETHYNPFKNDPKHAKGKKPWVTCREVIGDIDYTLPEDDSMQAGSKHKALLKLIPPGDNYLFLTKEREYINPMFKWRSRYWSFLLKLSPDKPSWTIQASHSNNMGPFHWNNRYLRINEIKRIQTFPDRYEFAGDFRAQWRQIGNAVPPLLAEVIARSILSQYFKAGKLYTAEKQLQTNLL